MSFLFALTLILVAAPFAGALLISLTRLSGRRGRLHSAIALLSAAVSLGLVLWLGLRLEDAIHFRRDWFAPAGIGVGFLVDHLSLLFALLIAGVSLLSLLYSLRYIPHEIESHGISSSERAYYAYMLLFTGSMLGMVFSGDLIQLYVFWELTGLASFLLIGLNWEQEKARRGAIKALVITALGGLAMLVGFILMGITAGTFSIPAIIEQTGTLSQSPVFLVALGLIVVGAITKSAQFPFHVWLPDAMVAPTPVSAFLHSAALVAAGVYLLCRVHPIFSAEPLWTALVAGSGTASVLVGGVLAIRAREFKQLLAYSTISQYGFIFTLLGYTTTGSTPAALFSFFNHGIIKAALFFSAGLVTYATATSRLGHAGAVWRRLPLSFAATAVLALSLGGVPGLAGFWMKEKFIAAILETGSALLLLTTIVAGALTLIYMLKFLYGAYLGPDHEPEHFERPPATMVASTAILAALTVVIGIRPGFVGDTLVNPAASAMLGRPVSLDLTVHLDIILVISLLALALGAFAFSIRRRWEPALSAFHRPKWSLDRIYSQSSQRLTNLGQRVLRLQNGLLPRYLYTVLLGLLVLVLTGLQETIPLRGQWETIHRGFSPYREQFDWPMALLLLLICLGTIMTFVLRRHLHVVLALSTVGYLIAGFFALEFAPDVALVQVHVETLVTVLFILALVLIPRHIRQRFVLKVRERISAPKLLLAGLVGLGSAWFSWLAIEHMPDNPIGPWFNENAYPLTGAGDIVAAILVEFRALDTLGEITVFATATIGVYVLVRIIRREML